MNMKYLDAIRNIKGHNFYHRIIELYQLAKDYPSATLDYHSRVSEILTTLYFLDNIDTSTYNALCDYFRHWFFRLLDIEYRSNL